jgi:hypothetical protein
MSITLSLADFADGGELTTTVKIRGREITCRPLSLHEKNALILAHPAPVPPLKAPEDKGSLAEKEPDTSDEAFVNAARVHNRERAVLTAAVSVGWTPAPSEVGLVALTFAKAVAINRGGQWAAQTLKEWQGDGEHAGAFNEAGVLAINNAVDALETAGNLGN